MSKTYQDLKDQGICTSCRKEPRGRTLKCPPCQERQTSRQREARQAKYVEGLCTMCDDFIEEGSEFKTCEPCRDYRRSQEGPRQAVAYHRRKDAGLCVDCALPLDEGYRRVRCRGCLVARRGPVTASHLRRFRRLVKDMNKLLKDVQEYQPGANWYLSDDTLNFMIGPSHDSGDHPIYENSVADMQLKSSGGGDW